MAKGERRRICRLVLYHLRPSHLADSGAPARGLRRLVREAGDDLPLLVFHAACDARASNLSNAAARWRRLPTPTNWVWTSSSPTTTPSARSYRIRWP